MSIRRYPTTTSSKPSHLPNAQGRLPLSGFNGHQFQILPNGENFMSKAPAAGDQLRLRNPLSKPLAAVMKVLAFVRRSTMYQKTKGVSVW